VNRNPAGRRALGNAIEALRKRDSRTPSQEGMASIADIDRTYYAKIEHGLVSPTFEKLWSVVSALGISWEDLGQELDRYPALRQRPITRSQMPASPRKRKRKARPEP
jgi:transcriptional regulator with XRE-family HTH domain